MSMTAIYAGRGDCILLESQGHYMLVDSGVQSESQNIVDYIKSLGLTRIDYVVSTHPDGDHVGGFASIFKEFEIGEVFYSPCSKDIGVYYDFLEALKEEGCSYSNPSYLQSWTLGDATVTVMYDGTQGSTYNESSLVLKVVCDGKSILLMGDLPSTIECSLIAQGVDLKCDVLKVGHHGAALSSCADFLDVCAPSIAVISSERGDGVILPRDSVLRRLARRFIKVYRTTDGNVTLNFLNGEITTTAIENNPFISLKNATVTLSQNVFTCNDSELRPDVTVMCNGQIVPPENYTVTYSNNIESGIAKVKIEGTEVKYVSSCSTEFLILPKLENFISGKISRTNSIKLSWHGQAGVSGYTVQYSTDKHFRKNLKSFNISSSQTKITFKTMQYNTKYYFRVRGYTKQVGIGKWSKTFSIKTKKKPTLKVINFAKKKVYKSKTAKNVKELKLTWKTDKNCDGYFIQYSTDKTFEKGVKTIRVSDGSTSSYIKKLKSKKVYYFRIRPYKKDVTKHDWGKIVKVRT